MIDATLLIVDDRADVRRSLKRFFGLGIRDVHDAGTPEEAEAILVERQPELLLCDYWLGPEQPTGTVLITRWREGHRCLKRVALMTGTKATSILATPGVDPIFQKPLHLAEVRDWLLAGL